MIKFGMKGGDIPVPQINEYGLELPPFFATPTKKGWKLLNPMTTIRNLAKRKHELSIDLTRSNVRRPIVTKGDALPSPEFKDFSAKDQEKLREWEASVNAKPEGSKGGTHAYAHGPVKERGRPVYLAKNGEHHGMEFNEDADEYGINPKAPPKPKKARGRPKGPPKPPPPPKRPRGRPKKAKKAKAPAVATTDDLFANLQDSDEEPDEPEVAEEDPTEEMRDKYNLMIRDLKGGKTTKAQRKEIKKYYDDTAELYKTLGLIRERNALKAAFKEAIATSGSGLIGRGPKKATAKKSGDSSSEASSMSSSEEEMSSEESETEENPKETASQRKARIIEATKRMREKMSAPRVSTKKAKASPKKEPAVTMEVTEKTTALPTKTVKTLAEARKINEKWIKDNPPRLGETEDDYFIRTIEHAVASEEGAKIYKKIPSKIPEVKALKLPSPPPPVQYNNGDSDGAASGSEDGSEDEYSDATRQEVWGRFKHLERDFGLDSDYITKGVLNKVWREFGERNGVAERDIKAMSAKSSTDMFVDLDNMWEFLHDTYEEDSGKDEEFFGQLRRESEAQWDSDNPSSSEDEKEVVPTKEPAIKVTVKKFSGPKFPEFWADEDLLVSSEKNKDGFLTVYKRDKTTLGHWNPITHHFVSINPQSSSTETKRIKEKNKVWNTMRMDKRNHPQGMGIGGALSADELKKLLGASYDAKTTKVNDFHLDPSVSSKTTKVYHNDKTGQTVVAHMGTQGITDWGNNAVYALGGKWAYKKTDRYKEAKKVQDAAEKKYGAKSISTIGHSQGGLQAELLGKNSKETITVNKATVPFQNKTNANQHDVRTQGDVVSALNPFAKKNKKEIEIGSSSYNPLTNHSADTLGNLDPNQMIGQGLDWEHLNHGSFTEQFHAFQIQHPNMDVDTLEDFAEKILQEPEHYRDNTIKRARFYMNVILKKKSPHTYIMSHGYGIDPRLISPMPQHFRHPNAMANIYHSPVTPDFIHPIHGHGLYGMGIMGHGRMKPVGPFMGHGFNPNSPIGPASRKPTGDWASQHTQPVGPVGRPMGMGIKLKKGSQEAKDYMASIRKKRMKGGAIPPPRSRSAITDPSLL